jgi:hypothetical protein
MKTTDALLYLLLKSFAALVTGPATLIGCSKAKNFPLPI